MTDNYLKLLKSYVMFKLMLSLYIEWQYVMIKNGLFIQKRGKE